MDDKKQLNELFTKEEQEIVLDWICSNIKSYLWDDIKAMIANESYKYNKNSVRTEVEHQLKKANVITARKSENQIAGFNLFIEGLDELDIVNESVSNVYESYLDTCRQNKVSHLSKKLFGAELRKHFGLDVMVTTRDGKSTRIYVKY